MGSSMRFAEPLDGEETYIPLTPPSRRNEAILKEAIRRLDDRRKQDPRS